MEQMDPDPFMSALNQYGLPWQVIELPIKSADPHPTKADIRRPNLDFMTHKPKITHK